MRLSEILTVERIVVDPAGAGAPDKTHAIQLLARLLCSDGTLPLQTVETLLLEREALQSTGIGDGVAIPHTSLEEVDNQKAALLLLPQGLDFDAIDGQPAFIIFGVIGPKRAASDHLKILAKVSRLLKSPETRRRLLESGSNQQAYSLIEEQESSSMGT